uniref:Uncharacterized protein n=1 Tax=Lygus hesperus TaxID=30085 RepID=A0A0A9ZAB2_LYGHE
MHEGLARLTNTLTSRRREVVEKDAWLMKKVSEVKHMSQRVTALTHTHAKYLHAVRRETKTIELLRDEQRALREVLCEGTAEVHRQGAMLHAVDHERTRLRRDVETSEERVRLLLTELHTQTHVQEHEALYTTQLEARRESLHA